MFSIKNTSGWLGTVVLWLLASILTACALGPPTPTPEARGGGGEFRVLMPGDPVSLNPDLRIDDMSFYVAQNLFNKLVTLDADFRIIPDLAERWEVSTDGLTYTFQLAKNVKWHDGQPFTSADVKWTLEAIASQKGIAQEVGKRIAGVETPDANTAVVRLKENWSPFLSSLAWHGTFILPKHLYEGSDWSKNPANEKPIGTGAFKFVEWSKGEHITLAANGDYFRRGPFLDRVTYHILKDGSTAPDLVLKDEADYTLVAPRRDRVPELQKTEGVQIKTFPNPARYYLGFNLRRKPFDDARVRRAFNLAINRALIVSRAFFGLGTPGTGFYTPAIAWAFNPNAQAPAFDTAAAQKLLDEAGLKPDTAGTRLKVNLVTYNLSPFKEIVPILQEQFNAVGVAVTPQLGAVTETEKRISQDRDFDLVIYNGSFGPDPENLNARFGSQGNQSFTGYASAEFDAALAEGARQISLQDRARAYFKAQEILASDLPLAPLVDTVLIVMTRANVTGLGYTDARGLVTFQNYSLVRIKR